MQRDLPEFDSKAGAKLKRRGFLKCMAWTGSGVIWTVSAGGLLTACGQLSNTAIPNSPTAQVPSAVPSSPTLKAESFSFVQLSDTHIGFNAEGVNTDVIGSLKQTVALINALPQRPALVLHTGDVTHLSKPEEFDTAYQLMNTIKTDSIYYVPGEHDVIDDHGAGFRKRFNNAKTSDKTWYSLDYKGVHFIGLSNAGELDAFGLLGYEQLNWLKQDLSNVKKDTPIVLFAHVPLYSIYPEWGWETKDGGSALALLKPFSAVTILNGHIHQVLSQVEGNIQFYTASSTAFPQHRPGDGKPNAYKLPADELLRSIGYRNVTIIPSKPGVELSDITLAGTPAATMTFSSTPAKTTPSISSSSATTNTVDTVDVGTISDFANFETSPKSLKLTAADKTELGLVFIVKQGTQYIALSNICTHQGCAVSWSGVSNRFLCPCHGSEYDLLGQNLAGPAPKPLNRYKSEIVNGRLVITIPK